MIDHYGIEMNVMENNAYEITETLDVIFSSARHGIIRNIPLYFDDISVKISRISVKDYEYQVDNGRDEAIIRIGSADSYVEGAVHYSISYLYDVGADKLSDMDEFNHNLIGTQWDTDIKATDFQIILPKDFDPEKVNCTAGAYGSTDSSTVKWTVEGRTISGNLLKPLKPFEGVTVALPLPEGYWEGAKTHHPQGWLLFSLLGYPLYAMVILLSFIIWFRKGRDTQLFPSVEFEPPEDLTPSEIGYIVDGDVDNKDVTSLIIYWAQKGYLAIEQEKDDNGKTKDLDLIKLNTPGPEARSYERHIFKNLFKNNSERVSLEDLRNTFYKTINWGANAIEESFTKHAEKRIYAKGTGGATALTAIFAIMPVSFLFLEAFRFVKGRGPLPIIALFFSIFLVVAFVYIGKSIATKTKGDRLVFFVILCGIVLGLGVVAVIFLHIPLLKFAAAVTSTFIVSFFIAIMSKRTPYGDKILEKVLGFREFIKEAEKEKLEMMFESDPAYFYNILPFAVVMGLSDKWSSHFGGLAVEPPSWYRGYQYDHFNTRLFEKDLSRSFSTISSSMSSSPSSSGSSGSSSSGGFSGGGSGGGGGSSW